MEKQQTPTTLLGHEPLGLDLEAIRESMMRHLTYELGKIPQTATERDWFYSLTYAIRDRLVERLMETFHGYYHQDSKRLYYLSLEFLIGRSLVNNLLALDLEKIVRALLPGHMSLDQWWRLEEDAGLGNGGLGRLAACILDSLATLDLPGYGYGIRYEYGMFTQRIENGWQVEHPENWLRYGNPWEFPRPEVLYPVHFRGHVVQFTDEQGQLRNQWIDTDQVMAMAYDFPIPGHGTRTVNNLRLWTAKSTRDFELKDFNEGNYIRAIEKKTESENLSRVLYPNDATAVGRELRLRQEYFFISASLQDILRRFNTEHADMNQLPDKVVIQLNDTHPALAIAEWMRLLVDRHRLAWDHAWDLTRRVFAYTNHTLMPEALETWAVSLFEQILPRHLQIIYEINHHFLKAVSHRFPGDVARLRRMSIIDEEQGRRLRMAHLAIVGSQRVNGVSALHTRLLKERLFRDFHEMYPDRLVNVTNGVTPRRWIKQANPGLAQLLDQVVGAHWVTDLDSLYGLEVFATDAGFQAKFQQVKSERKQHLTKLIKHRTGIALNPQALFDVQVKRLHEYKRQLLNLLHVVTHYFRLREGRVHDPVPRAVIFGGKAAPSYEMAKRIIKLINDVAEVVNHDPATQGLLQLVFIPNYDVSTAMELVPAADLSEQISTAGLEASGTGNMKFSMNGALTIGTLDGANIEIREAVGADYFFLFGLTADQVSEWKRAGYYPLERYESHAELHQAIDCIRTGFFSSDDRERHRPVVDRLLYQDPFMVLADYADYLRCQSQVEALYRQPTEWTRWAILNVARMGAFSIDRTVREYVDKVWGIRPAQ